MDEKSDCIGEFDPNIPEEGPSAPPPGWLDSVEGYEDPKDEDCPDQICPLPPDFVLQPEQDRNASVPNVKVPQVSEDVAREALLQFVGKKWAYSSKPAQNLIFKDLRPFTVYRYRLETFTESRSSSWEHEIYNGQAVDGAQYGVVPPPWQVEVQHPPRFTDMVQKVRVPHTASVKTCYRCRGKGQARCMHCHGRGRTSCLSCHGVSHGRNRRCTGCHGRGNRVCTWCHGSGNRTCRKCNGNKKLLHFIELKVTWKNQVYEFIPDRQPEFPVKKFEKVSGEAFFTDESVLVYPIVGFPDQEICDASKEAIQEHLTKYSVVSRILQQRQTIELVPFTRAFYSYNGKDYDYFVYGTENRVHTTKYPSSCTVL
ncbi:protein SSUH2 homolog [Brachyhypopomus gauderio]|uniref:protein SSUH2 homolog n=1 Tax=Brachyhypopomus gauderio TaxID=698409 RepID=UPI0040432363